MPITLDLEYTPFSPQEGLPFTEASFIRRSAPFRFEIGDIGIALVDVWNFGWENSPVGETLGPELSFERGRSHAMRKRRITEEVIGPAVHALRDLGVQIFHCNHVPILEKFPQWTESTTESERAALKPKSAPAQTQQTSSPQDNAASPERWPPQEWVADWKAQHESLVWKTKEWGSLQNELYPMIAIPPPVQPQAGDLLVYSGEQFHRLLTERRIRALFYMGFEADHCLMYSGYGIANMQNDYCGCNYLCSVVRDGTTTYEVAETLEGQWRTRMAVLDIESRFGYSITAAAFVDAVAGKN